MGDQTQSLLDQAEQWLKRTVLGADGEIHFGGDDFGGRVTFGQRPGVPFEVALAFLAIFALVIAFRS